MFELTKTINLLIKFSSSLTFPGQWYFFNSRILSEIERPLISICLNATKGNQIKASKLLGLNRNTLRKKIKELQIKYLKNDTKY